MLTDFLKPHLKSFCDKFSDMSLKDYHGLLFTKGTVPSDTFINAVISNIKLNYGDIDEENVRLALKHPQCVYCANHGGIENHPELIASSLMSSYFAPLFKKQALIILACTSIGPKNPTVPGGFLLGKRLEENHYKRKRISFIPRKYDLKYLCSLRALKSDDIKRKLNTVSALASSYELSAIEAFTPENFGDNSFLSQCFKANSFYIKRFLTKVPHCPCYFVDDSVLISDLLKISLANENSFIFKIFNSPHLLYTLCKNLKGRANLWSDERVTDNWKDDFTGRGSVLFYRKKDSGTIEQLSLVKDKNAVYLRSADYTLKVTPQNIIEALNKNALIADLYLGYICLTLDYNVSLIGGIFFNYYIKDMLEITAKTLNLPKPTKPIYSTEFIQSFLTPFKVITPAADPFSLNKSRPLLQLDLHHLEPINETQASSLLTATVKDALPLSIADMLLDFDLSDTQITDLKQELVKNLNTKSPIEFYL